MADQRRINGVQISWSSCKLTIDGESIFGFISISFKDALEVSYAYGAGRDHGPRGRSAGKYTPDPVVISMWASTAQEVRRMLSQRAQQQGRGNSYGKAVVPIVLQYIEADDSTMTIEFEECRYLSASTSNEEGADALKEDVEFSPMRLRRNGLVLFDESEG
jgi:hypothetical protein